MSSSRRSRSRLADDEGSAEEGARAGVLTRAAAVKAARAQSRDPRCDVADIGALSLERRSLREIAPGALAGFVGLIELDLSRNELTSLRGLAAGIGGGAGNNSAPSLISLSLYYNRIVYLEEVKHLVTLRKLQRLDLRLNPLTRDEAYRSYVVFHIPSLQELDERSVRPAERRHAKHTVDAMNRLELKNKDGAYGVGGMGDNEEDEERLEEDAFRQVMQTASAPGKVISEQVRSSTAAMVATADETEAEGSASRLDTKPFGVASNAAVGTAAASPETDALLEEVSTVIASVQLPSQLSLSAVTLIHMPDLVARSARPAVRQVLDRALRQQYEDISSARETIRCVALILFQDPLCNLTSASERLLAASLELATLTATDAAQPSLHPTRKIKRTFP